MNPIEKRGDFDAGPQGQENLNDVFYGLVEAGQHYGEQQPDAGMRFRRKRMGHGVTNEIQNPLFPRSAGFAALAAKLAAARHGRVTVRALFGEQRSSTLLAEACATPVCRLAVGAADCRRRTDRGAARGIRRWDMAAVPRGVTVLPPAIVVARAVVTAIAMMSAMAVASVVTPQQDVE